METLAECRCSLNLLTFIYLDIVDFRKSINILIVLVERDMNLNPFRCALFVFCNKKRDQVKILNWDKTDFAL
ncbi:IS66 family insertion sequence element accessory protein TnpB [Alteromonas alvinellae]